MNSTLPYGGGYADLHVGLPMRRAILIEVAEVRGRRDARKRLVALGEAQLRHSPTRDDPMAVRRGDLGGAVLLAEGPRVVRELTALRKARLESDRAHLASLMRLLHALRGDA